MASKRSRATDDWTGRRIDFVAFSARLAARRAELGLPDTSAAPELAPGRNSGNNRTPSKRALLKAIAEAGGKW